MRQRGCALGGFGRMSAPIIEAYKEVSGLLAEAMEKLREAHDKIGIFAQMDPSTAYPQGRIDSCETSIDILVEGMPDMFEIMEDEDAEETPLPA